MKTTRFILLAGFLLGAGIALVQCGPTKCSAANCSGCCDPGGACLAGTANPSCGKGGVTCAACTGAQTCVAQVCTGAGGGTGGGTAGGTGGGGGGTGGGTTGGGTGGGSTGGGTGGGGTFTCSSVRTFSAPFGPSDVASVRFVAYSGGVYWNRVRFDLDSADGGLYAYQQVYVSAGQAVPFTQTFPSNETWLTSLGFVDGGTAQVLPKGSAMGLTECSPAGLCSKRYLSLGGTGTYTRVGTSTNGVMTGTSTNVRLVAWDYQTETTGTPPVTTILVDQPAANADCIDIASMSYDLTYHVLSDGGVSFTVNAPPDAGDDAGTDAGTDAGCDAGADGGC